MAELSLNEKRLLVILENEKKADAPHLAKLLDATPEAVVQWAHLAQDKGLATVERLVVNEFLYSAEGHAYLKNGLPETRLFRFILPGTTLADLQKHEAFRIGFGQLRKKGLIKVDGNSVVKIPGSSTDEDEAALANPNASDPRIKEFIKRGILQESETVRYVIAITPAGYALSKKGLDLREGERNPHPRTDPYRHMEISQPPQV